MSDSQSYKKNYEILKGTADWLTNQKEPDIDQLVPKVEEAMRAYQVCKERLDAVQATLGQYFQRNGDPVPSSDGDGRANRAVNPEADGEDDKDIPF
jgi:exodeoxyribonuclease VII small subunit